MRQTAGGPGLTRLAGAADSPVGYSLFAYDTSLAGSCYKPAGFVDTGSSSVKGEIDPARPNARGQGVVHNSFHKTC
jgi:hypothetical protein